MSQRLNVIASTQVKKLINLYTKGLEMSFFRPLVLLKNIRSFGNSKTPKTFLSCWTKCSYFTSGDARNLSPASGPLMPGKGKNPSPSPRVCIIFSWRWGATVLAIRCLVLGFHLSAHVWYLNSAEYRHICAAHKASVVYGVVWQEHSLQLQRWKRNYSSRTKWIVPWGIL